MKHTSLKTKNKVRAGCLNLPDRFTVRLRLDQRAALANLPKKERRRAANVVRKGIDDFIRNANRA